MVCAQCRVTYIFGGLAGNSLFSIYFVFFVQVQCSEYSEYSEYKLTEYNEIINGFVYFLQQKHNKLYSEKTKRHINESIILSTQWWSRLFTENGYNYENVKNWTLSLKLQKALKYNAQNQIQRDLTWIDSIFDLKRLLIPLHWSNLNTLLQHWTGGCIEFNSKRIIHANSSPNGDGKDLTFFRNSLKFVRDELRRVKELKDFEIEKLLRKWKLNSFTNYGVQKNVYDCGVHVCEFLYCMNVSIIPVLTHSMCAQSRKKILTYLLNNKCL